MIDELVIVEWWDHSSTAIGWEPRERMEGQTLDRCISVGRVIASHPDRIVLASSWVPTDGEARPKEDVGHVAILARACIISVRKLRPAGKGRKKKK